LFTQSAQKLFVIVDGSPKSVLKVVHDSLPNSN
jgi:hypothetical protein